MDFYVELSYVCVSAIVDHDDNKDDGIAVEHKSNNPNAKKLEIDVERDIKNENKENDDSVRNSDGDENDEKDPKAALVSCCFSPLTKHHPLGKPAVSFSVQEEPESDNEKDNMNNEDGVKEKGDEDVKNSDHNKNSKNLNSRFQLASTNHQPAVSTSAEEPGTAVEHKAKNPIPKQLESGVEIDNEEETVYNVDSDNEEGGDEKNIRNSDDNKNDSSRETAFASRNPPASTNHQSEADLNKKQKPKKPKRLCIFCGELSSRLPRHILNKHEDDPLVKPLLTLKSRKEQLFKMSCFRRVGIQTHNLKVIDKGVGEFQRERSSTKGDVPFMCSGCDGFFSKTYSSRHKKKCPALGNNFMIPVGALDRVKTLRYDDLDTDFKNLLNDLRLDEVGNLVKEDPIILMIGVRSFESLKKKKDKKKETKRTVRGRMRLLGRLYLGFKKMYGEQSEVTLPQENHNAGDMFHRGAMLILGRAINTLCEKDEIQDNDVYGLLSEKSGLKIAILNLLKLVAKYLTGYYLMKRKDDSAQQVVDFLKVLKYYEDDIFGDAYYALNHKKNTTTKKAKSLTSDEDIDLIYEECRSGMNLTDSYTFVGESEFVKVRTPTATSLTIFNARRGGEPVRLLISQWYEALNGDWIDEEDRENDEADLLITFQTG